MIVSKRLNYNSVKDSNTFDELLVRDGWVSDTEEGFVVETILKHQVHVNTESSLHLDDYLGGNLQSDVVLLYISCSSNGKPVPFDFGGDNGEGQVTVLFSTAVVNFEMMSGMADSFVLESFAEEADVTILIGF